MPFCCRICMVLVFLALIVIPISFAWSTISVRVMSRSEAEVRNAMSSIYAATFYFSQFPFKPYEQRTEALVEDLWKNETPLLCPSISLEPIFPMLIQFYNYKSWFSNQKFWFIYVTSLRLWSILSYVTELNVFIKSMKAQCQV